jgi:hypothetical protein
MVTDDLKVMAINLHEYTGCFKDGNERIDHHQRIHFYNMIVRVKCVAENNPDRKIQHGKHTYQPRGQERLGKMDACRLDCSADQQEKKVKKTTDNRSYNG